MVYIFIALIFYTIAIMFGTAASRHANSNLVAALTNLVAAVIPLVVAIPILNKKEIGEHKFGVVMALLAGVAIAIFAMAIIKSYSFNKVGIVVPIVFGGAIFLSTILSYFIFKEKVSQFQLAGLIILAVGFGLIIYARSTGK
jgi:drug/metabolite transporter (DMT)-like permease